MHLAACFSAFAATLGGLLEVGVFDSSSNCSPQPAAENKGDSADLQAASAFRCKLAGNTYSPGNNASCTDMTSEVGPVGTEVHDTSKGAFVGSGGVSEVAIIALMHTHLLHDALHQSRGCPLDC